MPEQPHQRPEDDDIDIEALPNEAALPPWEPEGQPGGLTVRCGDPLQPPLACYALGVLEDVQGHGVAEPGREVGGVLLGQFVHASRGPLTRVDDMIIADSDQASRTHVTFTHTCWQRIHRELEQRDDGAQIVGWYHTHPGFGPFLSAQDLFIQENFFNHPLHVALVFDPVQSLFASFGWLAGQVVRADGCYIWAPGTDVADLSVFMQTVKYSAKSQNATR